MRDRRDGHAPVGAMLRYRRRDRVMRARLIPVAVRTGVSEQPVDQDARARALVAVDHDAAGVGERGPHRRSEEHTSELQSLTNLVCRLLLEKKKNKKNSANPSQDK